MKKKEGETRKKRTGGVTIGERKMIEGRSVSKRKDAGVYISSSGRRHTRASTGTRAQRYVKETEAKAKVKAAKARVAKVAKARAKARVAKVAKAKEKACLVYTSDATDDLSRGDIGGARVSVKRIDL